MSDSIDDILNKDHIFKDIDELAKAVEDNFDNMETIVILWQDGDNIHHRAYGTVAEVLGLMEKAKYIMLRENIGDTIGDKG